MAMLIKPALSLKGVLTLPGDKSISHRSAMIAALANGDTRISNFAASADCGSTLECLSSLGVQISRDGNVIVVKGVGRKGLQAPDKPLDCGNSGTTMRLMSGILAAQGFSCDIVGDSSLSRRPMKRVIEPLSEMGAQITSVDGHPPLSIKAAPPLKAIEYRPSIASAQLKSCILLAGINALGTTTVHEPVPTRDHTERMLRWFGGEIEINGSAISIRGGQDLAARDIIVPGDISAAAFFLIAAACLPGSELEIPNIGLNPTRSGVLEVLTSLGVTVKVEDERHQCNEPVGDIVIRSEAGRIGATNNILRGGIIANIIDEIPILAVLGTQLEQGLEIRDAAELRVKESDRIASVVENLRRMNANVDEFPDGLKVYKSQLTGATIDSFHDHRIAMAFSIAALFAKGETYIEHADCVNISFPGFYEALDSVAVRSENIG